MLGRSADVVVVPLGATEQHGPHLPLGTDTMIASRWRRGWRSRGTGGRADAAVRVRGEHAGFAGTLSIGQDALRLVVVELARSWSGPVLFVCAHGGNAEPLAAAMGAVGRTPAPGPPTSAATPTRAASRRR